MGTMRAVSTVTLLLFGVAAAAAQAPSGTFNGTMECGRLPFANQTLTIQATLTISGGTAQFSRAVLHPQTNAPIGTETGTGRVGPNGQVSVRTAWRGRQDRLSGSYSGRLTAAGGTLAGRQSVSYQGRDYPRRCTITFRR